MKMTKVAVLGAGINGLACAVKIKEKYPDVDVTIFSNDFTPNTTGDGSGGLWNPYLCGNTPKDLLTKWGIETFQYLHKLWKEGGYDICLMPMYELIRKERELPQHSWANQVFGYRTMGQKQLDFLSRFGVKYVAGRTFTTFVVYPPTILAHLYDRFNKANGNVVQAKLSSLEDPRLQDYDVVINCTGLGARDLVPDTNVFPIRGHIMRMNASWINYSVVDEDTGHYIIPNVNNCVIGGTHQENDYSYNLNEEDTKFITNGCQELIPGLKNAELLRHWVGLRPGRNEIRLEAENKDGKLYIHNYGHGGSGLTLFWGCSSDVLEIFEKHMKVEKQHVKSKL
ncbi:D-amino acid oxidase [Epargyreus clarus]|uniref:D-amino acid oxidase n=1 Tax=Epargyreus clarus TaxID=520877 RepID=UPI003C3051B9